MQYKYNIKLIEGRQILGSSQAGVISGYIPCSHLPACAIECQWRVDENLLAVRPLLESGFTVIRTAFGPKAFAIIRPGEKFQLGDVTFSLDSSGSLFAEWADKPSLNDTLCAPQSIQQEQDETGSEKLPPGLYISLGSNELNDVVVDDPLFPQFCAKLLWDGHHLAVQPDFRSEESQRVQTDSGTYALAFILPGQWFVIGTVRFSLDANGRLTWGVTKFQREPASIWNEPFLSVEHLTDHRNPHTLDDVSFRIPGKQLTALVGPSGTGKTTLLNCLLQDLPGLGCIRWGDQPVCLGPDGNLQTALVPQHADVSLPKNLQVRATLKRAYWIKNNKAFWKDLRKQREHRVERALRVAGFGGLSAKRMREFESNYCANLSGGEQKRISMALELLSDPDVMLLDEPNSGVDADVEKMIFDSLRSLLKNSTVKVLIISTHSLSHVKETDYVLALGTHHPGQHPAYVAYCGPKGQPGGKLGLYHEIDCARNDDDLMEKLANGIRGRDIT